MALTVSLLQNLSGQQAIGIRIVGKQASRLFAMAAVLTDLTVEYRVKFATSTGDAAPYFVHLGLTVWCCE